MKEATVWLGERLAEYAPRFATERDRDTTCLATIANSTAERLDLGTDVSFGFYLERPSYLSLAVVACFPNGSKPELVCPLK